MVSNLVVLWLAALPLMGSPGPATMSLAAIGSAFGVRPGLRYLLGIIAGTFCVLVLIATGITGLILAQPGLVWLISAFAAAYILYLAYKIATAPVLSGAAVNAQAPSFAGGFALAIANPKAFAAIGAVYSSNTLLDSNVILDALAKISALLLVIVLVNTAWLVFGSMLSAFLRNPRTGRIANVTFAVLLVVSVGLALLGG